MYYLAEFLNYYPFAKHKIELFTEDNKAFLWLDNHRIELSSNSLDYLSVFESNVFPHNWFIYSHCNSDMSLENRPQLPLGKETSLSESDAIMYWFSSHFNWAIIPWGGSGSRFNAFIFISCDQSLRDSFINNCNNIVDIRSYAHIPNSNLLIAKYDVQNIFSDLAGCVLIDEDLEEIGTLLWDVCNLNIQNLPWVISYPMDDDEPPFHLINLRENEDYRYITTLEFTTRENCELYPEERLGIYEPQNRAALVAMLQVHWQDPDILLVVPNNINFKALIRLLRKTGHYGVYTNYSDLSFFQEILDISEWFYELNADRNDYKYSMFTSKNNELIRKIEKFCCNQGNYKLISLF
jgi:hypothetical protein